MPSAEHRLMPDYRERSGKASLLCGLLMYLALWQLLIALLPDLPSDMALLQGTALIGLVRMWRWSWAAVHFSRMLIYRHLLFPRMRARAEGQDLPPALYILVTSYRMSAELNAAVYGRLLDELDAMRVPACVVACISDPADAHLLHLLFQRRAGLAEGTTLHVLPQDGTGKRSAMAGAIELILSRNPAPGSQVVLMDGDTLLAPGALTSTCRLLASQPDTGAVTTNNIPLVKGTAWTREWYRLRMLQRDALMCSMSLSRRLLVLTGRFSVFRAEVVREPDFLRRIERDVVVHWRFGTIPLVTGDDKSTWYSTLSQGWRMVYAPDVAVYCMEELPSGGFFRATTALMMRWFGNMGRNSGRAIALGRRRLGTFAWLCLVDQRISPWTTIGAPLTMLYAGLVHSPAFLTLYAMWVLSARTFMAVLIWLSTGRFHPFFPLLIYYSQVTGSLIKIFVFHHPDRQKWNRQKVGARTAPSRGLSHGFLTLSLGGFLLLLVLLSSAPWTDPHQGMPTGLAALLDTRPPQGTPRPACGSPGAMPCMELTAPPVRPRFQSP